MPSALILRDAQLSDIPALAALLGELLQQEHEFTADLVTQARGLELLLARQDQARIIVAESGGRIIVMAALHYTISTALGARVATLEDVIVTSSARGDGVGTRLMSHVIETARADGAVRITLLTDHDNHAAQHFYRAHGFTKSTMVPYRRLLVRSETA